MDFHGLSRYVRTLMFLNLSRSKIYFVNGTTKNHLPVQRMQP